ncbi:hypothetical protein HYU17_03725 [Candidatus Woesearchaeota archaeon]|nr:hypothetical protein [Candidatus Woesearchaeota archaeon]
MVGATVLSATAAADLKNYPDPFVKDGKFNAVLVVGDSAASSDVIGSVDIATSLQFAARVKKTIQSTGGGQVSISGADAWRVQQGAKKLEFSETRDAGSASVQQENVRNITTFISDDELPSLLADGTFSNTQGDYDYRQYIYFDSNPAKATPGPMLSVVYAEDPDTSVAANYLFVDGGTGNNIARYALEFTESAKSDVTDSAGTLSATGTFLWNFEGKNIKMLGKDWSIVKARTDSANHFEVDMTMMGGAVKDVLNEGETKTYTIGGKDYEVTLDFVGSTSTKLTINGAPTDSLQEGSTQTLADGTQIGIRDILAQDFAGGVRKTEFYLGADKVRLRDTNTVQSGSAGGADGAQTLEVGTETITGTKVSITGTNTSNSYTLTSINVNVTANEDEYIPAGGKLSKQLRRPQALLNSWDIEYGGLEPVTTEKIKLTSSGSTQYYLEFADGAGKNVKIPLAYTAGTTQLKLGDSDDDTVLNENQSITKNDYFVITDGTQKQGERRTYGMRYISALASSETSPKVEFQDLGTGGKVEVDYKATDAGGSLPGAGTEDATLKFGGGTFKIWNASADTSSNFNLKIDLDGDSLLESTGGGSPIDPRNFINVTTKGGAQIVLAYHPINATNLTTTNTVDESVAGVAAGSILFSVQTVDADDYDNVAPLQTDFNISAASGKVDLAEDTTSVNVKYITPSSDTNLRQRYSTLGAFTNWKTVSNDPDSLEIDYPVNGQRLPIVVVTAPGATVATTTASEAGQVVYYETTPVEVGSAKLATEVSDIKAQNAIVVGGPCANAAAAEVMGNPADCAEGFTEGKAMLKLVEHANGKVALLVAGASAMDTRRASRVLADYAKWQEKGVLKGTEVEVAGTSFTDISVAAPAPKPVAAPAPAPAPAPAAETPAPAAEAPAAGST